MAMFTRTISANIEQSLDSMYNEVSATHHVPVSCMYSFCTPACTPSVLLMCRRACDFLSRGTFSKSARPSVISFA
jgi:hypothetical protein